MPIEVTSSESTRRQPPAPIPVVDGDDAYRLPLRANVSSALALCVEDAGVQDNVLAVDTVNGRVGINGVPSYELDLGIVLDSGRIQCSQLGVGVAPSSTNGLALYRRFDSNALGRLLCGVSLAVNLYTGDYGRSQFLYGGYFDAGLANLSGTWTAGTTHTVIGGYFRGHVPNYGVAIASNVIVVSGQFADPTVSGVTGSITKYAGQFLGDVAIAGGKNLVLSATTGTKFGTSASQKLAFYNATPVVQRAKANYNNWAALGDVVDALVALGLFDQA